MVFWAIIGTFIANIFGTVWNITKDFLQFVSQIMPKPMKFFMFLFMTIFLAHLVVPAILGIVVQCDSHGNAYNINVAELSAMQRDYEATAELCITNMSKQQTFLDVIHLSDSWNWAYVKLLRWISGQPTPDDINELCSDFVAPNDITNLTVSQESDFVLYSYGEKLAPKDYMQIISVGCVQDVKKPNKWYQTLLFFNVDLFNFEIWLMIGIASAIIPFAFWWYRLILKK